MYMLDTNICIYILKEHPEHIRIKFNEIEQVHISSIVYSELCYGIELGEQHLMERRWKQVNEFISLLTIHSWNHEAAKIYGKIRALLKKQGMLIGNMDMLIAAHAISLDATLVSNNVREFERIPDLKLENWY